MGRRCNLAWGFGAIALVFIVLILIPIFLNTFLTPVPDIPRKKFTFSEEIYLDYVCSFTGLFDGKYLVKGSGLKCVFKCVEEDGEQGMDLLIEVRDRFDKSEDLADRGHYKCNTFYMGEVILNEEGTYYLNFYYGPKLGKVTEEFTIFDRHLLHVYSIDNYLNIKNTRNFIVIASLSLCFSIFISLYYLRGLFRGN